MWGQVGYLCEQSQDFRNDHKQVFRGWIAENQVAPEACLRAHEVAEVPLLALDSWTAHPLRDAQVLGTSPRRAQVSP